MKPDLSPLMMFGVGAVLWRIVRRRPQVSLKDKVVIITGASSGIGRCAAYAFAAEGAHVVLVARRADRLEQIRNELPARADSGSALIVPTDITRDEDLETLVTRVMAVFGRIDVLVNNAGLSLGGPFHEQDAAAIRQLIDVNLYGMIRLTQLVLPVMLRQRSGHIVNIGSIAALVLAPGYAAYAATKTGVIGFSDSLFHEVDGTGVHVSVVMPGWTQTEMVSRLSPAAMHEHGLVNAFTGGFDPPEAIAWRIVDAVRHRRRQVIMGTPLLRLALWPAHYLTPRLRDFVFRWFFRLFDRQKQLEIMKDSGV